MLARRRSLGTRRAARIRPLTICWITVVLGLAVYVLTRPSGQAPVAPHRELEAENSAHVEEIPAIRQSLFSNARANVRLVGTAACAECHEDQHASYSRTAHSRALALSTASTEPKDAEYRHGASRRRYEVYREGDSLHHRESIPAVANVSSELVLADMPVKYTVGSGHYSKSYLAEDHGFLLESPVTWFAATDQWSMSPGYDILGHSGFRRVADHGCITCHAGRVEMVDNNRYKINIIDLSIGCENCHGPGGAHVDRRTNLAKNADSPDLSIVDFAKISRTESEMICSQCHLRGAATVSVRGRHSSDYLPGMQLTDFRIDYQLKQSGKSMKVTGHVEQMRLSKCYQNSAAMTCTTCHDPHAPPAEDDRVSYFRDKCLSCHADQGCALPSDQRIEQQDNCVNCHMPTSPTDIDHFAFTHHRVGVHDPTLKQVPLKTPAEIAAHTDAHTDTTTRVLGELVPVTDISHLPDQEQRRCLGLAYIEFADKQPGDEAFGIYRDRGMNLLKDVRREGLRDSDVDETLARLHWELGNIPEALSLANSAIALTADKPAMRTNSWFVIAESHMRQQAPREAIPALNKLTRFRRVSEDWNMLGRCRLQLGDTTAAIAAFEQSTKIDPYRPDTVQILSELYGRTGNVTKQQEYAERLKKLLVGQR
jgi:cytochrome c553